MLVYLLYNITCIISYLWVFIYMLFHMSFKATILKEAISCIPSLIFLSFNGLIQTRPSHCRELEIQFCVWASLLFLQLKCVIVELSLNPTFAIEVIPSYSKSMLTSLLYSPFYSCVWHSNTHWAADAGPVPGEWAWAVLLCLSKSQLSFVSLWSHLIIVVLHIPKQEKRKIPCPVSVLTFEQSQQELIIILFTDTAYMAAMFPQITIHSSSDIMSSIG